MTPRECYGCGEPFEADQRVWLMENDDLECDGCHDDRVREDPSDLYDHGHPYRVGLDRASLMRYVPPSSPNKGAIPTMTRSERTALDDKDFEAARARLTTPNHGPTERPMLPAIREALADCKETNS